VAMKRRRKIDGKLVQEQWRNFLPGLAHSHSCPSNFVCAEDASWFKYEPSSPRRQPGPGESPAASPIPA
jgi:hypothetical protein